MLVNLRRSLLQKFREEPVNCLGPQKRDLTFAEALRSKAIEPARARRIFSGLLFTLLVVARSLVIVQDVSNESTIIEKLQHLGGSVVRDDKLPGVPLLPLFSTSRLRVRGTILLAKKVQDAWNE